MIDPAAFASAMAALGVKFGRVFDDAALDCYFLVCDPFISTEQFSRAARYLAAKGGRMLSPADLLDLALYLGPWRDVLPLLKRGA